MGKSGVRHVGEMGAVGEINTGEHDDLAARAEAVHLDEKLWKKAGGGDRERLGERGGGERGGENGGGRTGEIGRSGEIEKIGGDLSSGRDGARQLGGFKLCVWHMGKNGYSE